MTFGDILIDYIQNGQRKQIKLSKVDQKYYPPREPGDQSNVNLVMDSAYINQFITYIGNKMTEELNAEYERKQHEQQLKEMERQTEEHRKRQEQEIALRAQAKENYYLLQKFASGKLGSCSFCFSGLLTLTCSKHCQAPTRFNVQDVMAYAARILKEHKQLKEELATLKQQLQELQQPKPKVKTS